MLNIQTSLSSWKAGLALDTVHQNGENMTKDKTKESKLPQSIRNSHKRYLNFPFQVLSKYSKIVRFGIKIWHPCQKVLALNFVIYIASRSL
jgi:hypothetical protein